MPMSESDYKCSEIVRENMEEQSKSAATVKVIDLTSESNESNITGSIHSKNSDEFAQNFLMKGSMEALR